MVSMRPPQVWILALSISICFHWAFSDVFLPALFYMIPQSVVTSTAILAGNYMGARQGEDAEAIVSLGFIICFSYGSLAGAVLLFFCRPVRFFSE
jgi:hypothetical protein